MAGALYDLFDSTNDGFDQTSFGFAPIWEIIRDDLREERFFSFWVNWRIVKQYNAHGAVQAIYQNTIDYDIAPTIENLPDLTILQDFSRDNAIDLWAYSSDPESADPELTWQITMWTDWRCGASIDGAGNVDITPLSGWTGSCDYTIRVYDGIKKKTAMHSPLTLCRW